MVTEKEKALDLALSQIERQVGKGSIMRLGEASQHLAVETIPTGSLSLDMALGVGGVPRGRVTEIFGAESHRQVHTGSTHHGGGPKGGWDCCLYRCRARDGRFLRRQPWG